MLIRVPQRDRADCAICVVSMIMGAPYPYERVLQDSYRYPKATPRGTYAAWWKTYLRDEGFDAQYRFGGIHLLAAFGGELVGALCMEIPYVRMVHVVAVNEVGVVDPATKAPDHMSLSIYFSARRQDGVVFDPMWLGVWTRIPSPRACASGGTFA